MLYRQTCIYLNWQRIKKTNIFYLNTKYALKIKEWVSTGHTSELPFKYLKMINTYFHIIFCVIHFTSWNYLLISIFHCLHFLPSCMLCCSSCIKYRGNVYLFCKIILITSWHGDKIPDRTSYHISSVYCHYTKSQYLQTRMWESNRPLLI